MIENDTPADGSDHTYENVDEEEIRDHGGSLRVAVWIISALIAVVMVALPVIRVIDWGGDDDDESVAIPSQAQSFVATRWADATLVQRSTDEAVRWSDPSLRDTIEAIVEDLQRRPSTDFAGAAVSVARVECDTPLGPDSECFHAWIRQPGGTDLIRVQLVVAIVNGDAIVTDIKRVNVV